MANEFYLGALDLSPYIVSVWHQNWSTFWAKLDHLNHRSEPMYLALKEMTEMRHIPLFIAYDGVCWGFIVMLNYADGVSVKFTVRGDDFKYLVVHCPLRAFQYPLVVSTLKEMA